jgi:hypothetical protein
MWTLLTLIACFTDPGFTGGGSHTEFPQDTGDPPDDTGDVTDTSDTQDTTDTTDTTETGDTGDIVVPGSDDCGYGLNQVACDLILEDQSGATFRLYEAYPGQVVLVFGHAYDGNMIQIAGFADSVGDKRDADAVMVLANDPDLQNADQSDAADFATATGADTVLHSMTSATKSAWMFGQDTTTYVIDADMVIRWVGYGYVGESQLDAKVKDL